MTTLTKTKSKAGIRTPFGKFLHTLRIEHDEYMKDMAEKLGVTTGALSAAETGRRNVPAAWCDTLIQSYALSEEKTQCLKQAVWDSRSYENLNVTELNFEDRRILRGIAELLPTLEIDDARRKTLAEWIKGMPMPQE